MATILLSAVGAAAGASIGGGVFGLSSAVIGRALGAGIGRAIDQRIMGSGSEPVEVGRVDRFRIQTAGEGEPISRVYGRIRIGGNVIWASNFLEIANTTGGGKGTGSSGGARTEYAYSVSLAVGLCEGEITRVGRIWADGREIARDQLNLRVYNGRDDQLPDPKIVAIEGPDKTPAFRGTAYVVIEDLELGPFGNRVPQFSFEVIRPAQEGSDAREKDLSHAIKAVSLIPGTGEYALATTPVYYEHGLGEARAANVSTLGEGTDFSASVEALDEELPECGSVSLVVSWFGDDLRCGQCTLQPKVEQSAVDGTGMPWSVCSTDRVSAGVVPSNADGIVYGGTPSDASVIEAISALNEIGKDVVFYPFILMEQLQGNSLPDPWTGNTGQAALPWRGRITLSVAPGQVGTPDNSAAADGEVAQFFGNAAVNDFSIVDGAVVYAGPNEWSYRRMILHYAHLCVAAGGVDAFCIGSEMRGLTQIRGAGGSFPAVEALRQLAGDVRGVLGAGTKIGYAADWSEYFGYHPQDGSGDVLFHLDALWADAEIDFIGIDNYMPLSDWRDGEDHADAGWPSIYDLEYLKANIEGGEGFDWYYRNQPEADAQVRTAITDGAYGEPWIYRYKDIRNWWQSRHHNRQAGVRDVNPTAWVPESKPIWFTEFGCAAVDKGTNEPNKFVDPKSSESSLPKYSTGKKDELIQAQYIAAVTSYWNDPAHNPVSEVYAGSMIDMTRAHVWAWDARPYPHFPNNAGKWADAGNYVTGHWLNGRTSARSLAGVIEEICTAAGVAQVDTSDVHGLVRGYLAKDADEARAILQPLMLVHGLDAADNEDRLRFTTRRGEAKVTFDQESLALTSEQDTALERVRAPEAEMIGRVRIGYVDRLRDFGVEMEEASLPDQKLNTHSQTSFPICLSRSEASQIAHRWLAEASVARESVKFSLPPSELDVGAGDVVAIENGSGTAEYRVDRITKGDGNLIEATRVDRAAYQGLEPESDWVGYSDFNVPVPVSAFLMDLPLIKGDEIAHAASVAAVANPWPGTLNIFHSSQDNDYQHGATMPRATIIGTTENGMGTAAPSRRDRGAPLRVRLPRGALFSCSWQELLNGKNMAAIGDGTVGNWEVFQFASAELVDAQTFEISDRIRFQQGTDGIAQQDWPAGSIFVLLGEGLSQVDAGLNARGLERHYRIGPAKRPYSDPSFVHKTAAIDGVGLRPYAPAHLRVFVATNGDILCDWVRRTRVDGDTWQSSEVPLGEEHEQYVIRVYSGANLLRETDVTSPNWTYSAAQQAGDGAIGALSVEVAQVSAAFGPGLFRKVSLNV